MIKLTGKIGFIAAMSLAAWLLPGGCSRNLATGQMQYNMIGEDQEVGLGAQAAPGFIKEGGGELPNSQVVSHIAALGRRLAAVSERSALPWEFHVLNSPVINAFALPGGKVFITRGLLEKMENEAQLAGVLGHEVGHVTAQHIGQQMTRAKTLEIGLVVAGTVTENQWVQTLGGQGGQLYLLKFGRDQESQADELGLRYMTKLNYNPSAMVGVMNILKAATGGDGIEWLQTHPMPDTRIQRISDQIKKDYAATQNNPQYVLKAAEFQTNILAPIKALPPPPKAAAPGKAGAQLQRQKK